MPTDRALAAERAVPRSVSTAPPGASIGLRRTSPRSSPWLFVLVVVARPDRAHRRRRVHAGAGHLRRRIAPSRHGARRSRTSVALWARWGDFFAGLTNSLIVTTGATILAVAVSTFAGFGYSRWRSRFLAGSVFAMIALRLLPPIVTTLPLFPIVNALRLSDTYTVLIILYAAFFVSLGTMVMRTFIDQIPRELDEAAMIDGATQRQVLTTVILPLSAQGMVAVAIFVIVYAWNEFLFAFIFTTKRAKTAPLVMSEMIGSLEGVEWGVLFAATTVQLLPVLDFRHSLPAAPHRRPHRRRDERMNLMATRSSRPRARPAPCGSGALALRPAGADHRLRRLRPRLLRLDAARRQLRAHARTRCCPATPSTPRRCCRRSPTWDFGSHGSFDGSYALKLATKPRTGAQNVAIKRLTFRERGPDPARVLLHVQARGERAEAVRDRRALRSVFSTIFRRATGMRTRGASCRISAS